MKEKGCYILINSRNGNLSNLFNFGLTKN
uniref:Uncharacterized protein n=1 Tax=Rhizophora mucronata TaxID=61149 RepID=A0A2P2Q1B6_RHIMU